MNNRTYKLSNNFGVRIVVRENFLVSAALFCHIIRPVLRHTDAVTVAVCLKENAPSFCSSVNAGLLSEKMCSEGVSGKALAADLQAFHHARAAVRVDYIGYPAALVVSQGLFRGRFLVYSLTSSAERDISFMQSGESLSPGLVTETRYSIFAAPIYFRHSRFCRVKLHSMPPQSVRR